MVEGRNPSSESLASAEQQVMQQLGPALAAHSAVSEQAFNAVDVVLGALPELPVSQVPLSRQVATILTARLSNDMRIAALAALRGYPLQATALVASLFEVAHYVAYIGSNEERALDWANHNDPTSSFRSVKTIIDDTVRNSGIDEPGNVAAREYRTYRQLCLAKHANPLLQRDHGHYVTDEAIVMMNGPDPSEAAIRLARFALEHASRLTVLALASFVQNHIAEDSRERLYELLGRIDKEVRNLVHASVAEYGSEDPFPGRW